MGRTQRQKVGAWEKKYCLVGVWMTESASRAKWKKGFFLFFKKWGLLIFVIKTSIKYFFRNENNMVPCLWRNKLSNKYIRDKVEIMVVLFFERWKSVDKLWCLWTNYGLTLLDPLNVFHTMDHNLGWKDSNYQNQYYHHV